MFAYMLKVIVQSQPWKQHLAKKNLSVSQCLFSSRTTFT